ncbi:hypothetical protein CYY_008720 [Polysphondylium violaceum]|uniref:RING-type E3 ubiquitin transferase n=1 Tax=Polysphondylium violaceum TaxID=133409 RepID=A0A8J4PUR1_9MYCE|nr:hypothetical protein CYY_008720 [Polysphondylium violaceum]
MEVDDKHNNTSSSSGTGNENGDGHVVLGGVDHQVDHDMLCPICLENFDNIAFLDICFHQFCFVCILQWSEVNFKCPLCKSDFHSLIYDVKSNTDYKRYPLFKQQQYGLRKPNDRTTTTTATTTTTTASSNGNSFRIHHNNFQQQQQHTIEDGVAFRSRVYAQGTRAIPMVPAFKLHLNPISINSNFNVWRLKLEPWVNRELKAIIPTTETGSLIILQELIMEILRKHNIKTDPKVKASLERFLFHKTDHFIHELICFACSPFNMQAYDLNVKYNQVYNNNNNSNNNNDDQLKPLDQLFRKSNKTSIPPSLASILEFASEDTLYLDQQDIIIDQYSDNSNSSNNTINNTKRKRIDSLSTLTTPALPNTSFKRMK